MIGRGELQQGGGEGWEDVIKQHIKHMFFIYCSIFPWDAVKIRFGCTQIAKPANRIA